MLVQGQRKRPMTVHPTVGVGFTPGGVLIDAAKPLGNNTLILLFLCQTGPLALFIILSALITLSLLKLRKQLKNKRCWLSREMMAFF